MNVTKPARKVEKPRNTNRMLQKKEINDLFDTLKLSTPADREQFLRFERLSGETNLAQDGTNEALRVQFGDSTAR